MVPPYDRVSHLATEGDEGGRMSDEVWREGQTGRDEPDPNWARLRELLKRHPDLTAIFAGNDKMALGALSAAAPTATRALFRQHNA